MTFLVVMFVVALFAEGTGIVPAVAQSKKFQSEIRAKENVCVNGRGRGSSRYDACTWVIENAKFKGYRLAFMLHLRGDTNFNEINQYDMAIADYTAAIAADRTYAWPHFNRGRVYRRQGKLLEALADVETALRKFKPHEGCLPPLCDLRKEARLFAKEIKEEIEKINKADDKALCNRALSIAGTEWSTRQMYAIAEAERRGETIASCRTRLALSSPPEKVSVPKPIGKTDHEEPAYTITDADDDSAPPPQIGPPQKRVALVIGNSGYAVGALPNPVNDASAIARSLDALGFDTIQANNLNRAAMQDRIVDFENRARDADIALFFYAGHAVQLQSRNYLIPVDAKMDSETSVRFEAVELDLVAGLMTSGGAAGVILLDACRDNPFKNSQTATRGLSLSDGLATPSFVSGGLLYGFASAPGEVALDGKGDHSPFTAALLKHLAAKGMEIEQILKDVTIEVAEATGGKQVPWRNTNLTKKLYLNP